MLHLAASEHDRDLHLVAAAQKAFDVAALGVEVVVADLGPELYLPHVDVDLLFAGRLAGLLFLVFELAVVHHPDHRGVGVGGNFDEVEVGSLPIIHGLANVLDPQLLAVGRDQTHLARPDLTVYSGFFFSRYCAPLLSKSSFRGRSSTTEDRFARAPDGRRTPTTYVIIPRSQLSCLYEPSAVSLFVVADN